MNTVQAENVGMTLLRQDVEMQDSVETCEKCSSTRIKYVDEHRHIEKFEVFRDVRVEGWECADCGAVSEGCDIVNQLALALKVAGMETRTAADPRNELTKPVLLSLLRAMVDYGAELHMQIEESKQVLDFERERTRQCATMAPALRMTIDQLAEGRHVA